MTDMFFLHRGNCLDILPTLREGSVNLVLTDPPYGTTACKWDCVIPFGEMWAGVKHVTTPNAVIVMTASQPFTSALVMSQPKLFRHSWVWDKRFAANFSLAKYQPLKRHEDVVVFGSGSHVYFPQKTKRDVPINMGKNVAKSGSANLAAAKPEFTGKTYDDKNPESIISISNRSEGMKRLHPTQKPVALMEYLIRTYSREGDTVLDFAMGSGTTGVACAKTGRRFIGIEMDVAHFSTAQERIQAAYATSGVTS